MHDVKESNDKEATTTDADDATKDADGTTDCALQPEAGRAPWPWETGDSDARKEDRRLIAAKIARVARRLRELDAELPGAIEGPPDDPVWLEMLPGLLLDEGLWMDQAVTSHDRRDGLTTVTIDFRWTDVETGASIGPSTFIGYGIDESDHGVEHALAATVRTYLRHTFFIGMGGAGRATDAAGAVEAVAALPAPRLAAPRRPSN